MVRKIAIWEGFFLGIVLLVLVYFHTHGAPASDEGWGLQASRRFFEGEVVYRDFQFIYHPGILYVNAIAFKLLGISILSSRLLALTNSVIAVLLLFGIARRHNFSPLMSISALSLYIFWGPGHINGIWPVIVCLTVAIASVSGWQRWLQRPAVQWLILIGITSGLALLFKQNFGVASIASSVLFILLLPIRQKIKTLLWYAVGVGSVILAQLSYLLASDSLNGYVSDMRFLLLERIVAAGVLDSPLPWQYPAPVVYQVSKLLFYLLPLMITAAGAVIAWRQRQFVMLYFCIITASYYGLSIRPTTDYIHLAPLLALASVPLVYVLKQLKDYLSQFALPSAIPQIPTLIVLSFTVFAGMRATFGQYYRWNPPLSYQNYFLGHPRGLVSVDQPTGQQLELVLQALDTHLIDEPYLFVYSYTPTITFLSDRKNPTPYDYLHVGVLSSTVEERVKTELEQKNVKHVLTDVPVALQKDGIAAYIQREYTPIFTSEPYTIWKKK